MAIIMNSLWEKICRLIFIHYICRNFRDMKVKKARKAMREAFEKDPDFKRTYVDNVAMYLYDNTFGLDMSVKKLRDRSAEGIIDLIFN